MTEPTLNKLEEAFALGSTDEEACLYADISHQTLYNYQNKNPEFLERKELLKLKPILKARQTIVQGLDQLKNAQWYLERKKKDEFALRKEITAKDGKPVLTPFEHLTDEELEQRIKDTEAKIAQIKADEEANDGVE